MHSCIIFDAFRQEKDAGTGREIISNHPELLVYYVPFKIVHLFGMKIVVTLFQKVPEKKLAGFEYINLSTLTFQEDRYE